MAIKIAFFIAKIKKAFNHQGVKKQMLINKGLNLPNTVLKLTRNITALVVCVLSFTINAQAESNKETLQWDFDHGVQYSQNQVTERQYQLKVFANDKTPFHKLSTFLIRQALKVCGQYGYKLEILSGVEGIDDRRVSPNYIQPSLKATLECPAAE